MQPFWTLFNHQNMFLLKKNSFLWRWDIRGIRLGVGNSPKTVLPLPFLYVLLLKRSTFYKLPCVFNKIIFLTVLSRRRHNWRAKHVLILTYLHKLSFPIRAAPERNLNNTVENKVIYGKLIFVFSSSLLVVQIIYIHPG